MEPATWANCRADFAFDGALVDLRVPGTGPAEWEAFWAALREGPFKLRAFRDGEPIGLPESISWVFAEQEIAWVGVSVLAGTVTANCYFHGGDLELDVDPREITSDSAFESVLTVMRFIAAAIRLPVLAGTEGFTPPYAFIRVTPDGQAEFLRAGSISCG